MRTHEVKRLTYEVVDELTRFDERDCIFSRERLVTGSPDEHAHPEPADIDHRSAAFIEAVGHDNDLSQETVDSVFFL